MTFKINSRARLLLGSAINHLKVAATSTNEAEFNTETQSAIRALMGARTAANPSALDKSPGILLNDEIVALLTADGHRTGGTFQKPTDETTGKK